MMKRTILLMAVCLCFMGRASAQWGGSDPGNFAQGIINTAKKIVGTAGRENKHPHRRLVRDKEILQGGDSL